MTHLKIENFFYKIFKYNILPTGILIFGSEGCGHFKLVVQLIKLFFKKDILTNKVLPHPDIFFMYPLPKVKNQIYDIIDDIFIKFLVKKPYANFLNWKKEINSENIDCKISLYQVEYILKILNLKSYELSHKIVIIWMSEYLNISATKKLVNILDSPIKNVIFVFISENENLFRTNFQAIVYRINLNTMNLNTISKSNIAQIENKIEQHIIRKMLKLKLGKASLQYYKYYYSKYYNIDNSDFFDKSFKNNFIVWMRLLFGLKNKIDLLFKWCSNINLWSRDKKKRFLLFALEIFRIAHRYNYDKNYINPFWYDKKFNWKNFCKYINTKKVSVINKLINDVIRGTENFFIFLFSILYLSFNIKKILY
ncbi:hypothetical protein ACT2CL_00085 [Candidatus Karelsulcia muelleri]